VVDNGRLAHTRCEPPLTVKATMRGGVLELLLVGSAASLLEGDDLTIDIEVSGGVPVVVRSVAAQVAHPCPNGGSTRQAIRLRMIDGARVYWAVEPLIIAAGAEHTNEFLADVDSQSACVIHDTMLLGRSAESPQAAVVCAQMFVKHAGVPLLEDGFATTLPGAHGPAGLHGMRFVSTAIAAGWRPSSAVPGTMAFAGPGALLRSIAPDATSTGSALADAAASWWAELLKSP
jgi:urease accessory protein